MIEARAGAAALVEHHVRVALVRVDAGRRTARPDRLARTAVVPVGGEPEVDRRRRPVGHDVRRHPPVDDRPPGAARRTRSRRARRCAAPTRRPGRAAAPSRWMALRPRCGRAVWARLPPSSTRARIVPWHPASTRPPVGSHEDGRVGRPAARAGDSKRWTRPFSARSISSHDVEAPGHVDGRARAASWRGRASRRARPSCRRTRARRGCPPSIRGVSLPAGGTVSRWPAMTTRSLRPSSVRATTLSPTRSTLQPARSSAGLPPRGRPGRPRPG